MESTLNIVTSLIFIFLLYSLLATALMEAISTMFNRRADNLYNGIKAMLTDTPDYSGQAKVTRLFKYLVGLTKGLCLYIRSFIKNKKKISTHDTLYDSLYKHPVIKNYGENALFDKPSYISKENFSEILIVVLNDLNGKSNNTPATIESIKTAIEISNTIPNEVKKILKQHLDEAAGDMNVFKSRLEKWYTDSMDRISGWYKRNTHFWLFGMGLCMAMLMNVDSFEITTALADNPEKAKLIADMAEKVSDKNPDSAQARQLSNEAIEKIKNQANTVNTLVGLGWGDYGISDTNFIIYLAQQGEPCLLSKGIAYIPWMGYMAKERGRAYSIIGQIVPSGKPSNISLLNKVSDNLFKQTPNWVKTQYIIYRVNKSPRKMLGFFLSAIAIGLGAPFWFDLLNKVVKLRTAGKKLNGAIAGSITDDQNIDG